jgi:hypothetical protein
VLDGAGEPAQAQAHDELHEEQTHIFFSADELDEVTELRSERVQSVGPATLSDLIPPAPPERPSQPPPFRVAASGTYERAPSSPPLPSFAPANASQAGRTPYILDEERSAVRRPSRLTRYAVLALLMLTLGMATYAVPRFATAGRGSLSIETVDDPDALVRVDGVVRGNPPLLVEELTPGVHRLEIEAAGYEVARADVHVEQGQARSVKLILEKLPGAAGGSSDATPRTTPLAPPTGKVVVQRSRQATRPSAATEQQAAAPASSEQEHAVDGVLSEELSKSNQGELLISTVPWSRVFIDGIDSERDTPVRALRVAAGAHRVGLRTPDDVMHEFDVVVKPGQTVRIIRRF